MFTVKNILILAGVIAGFIVLWFLLNSGAAQAKQDDTFKQLSTLLATTDCKGTCKSICKSKPIFSLNKDGRNACQRQCESDCAHGVNVSQKQY